MAKLTDLKQIFLWTFTPSSSDAQKCKNDLNKPRTKKSIYRYLDWPRVF